MTLTPTPPRRSAEEQLRVDRALQELFERRVGLRSALLAALAGVAPLPRHGSSLQ